MATLTYPDGTTESVDAVVQLDGTAFLAGHLAYVPLAPGDVVKVDGHEEIVGVLDLAAVWTYEVEFPLPPDTRTGMRPTQDHHAMQAIAKLLEQWGAQGIAVTRLTNFTVLISSTDRAALDEALGHRLVEHADLRRSPATRIDLDVARRNADIDGDGGGPWA